MAQKILFATDGSENSRAAEPTVGRIARDGDTVIVLHVVPEPPAYMIGDDYDPIELEAEFTEASEKITNEAADRLDEQGRDVRTMVVHGHVGDSIVRKATENDVDHIVMGRRGRGTAGELLLGSVSHYVIQHSDVPVTVTPPVETD